MTGRGCPEKREIHKRLAEYRAAHGLGCYEALAKKTGGKISADQIRDMAAGEGALPLGLWRALGEALEGGKADADHHGAGGQ